MLFSQANSSINKSSAKSKKSNPSSKTTKGKRSKSSIGHAIKRPKVASSNVEISDSLKEILAKKKAFSISTTADKEVVQIQSQVNSLLDTLDEQSVEIVAPNQDKQVQKINALIALVEEPAAGQQPLVNKNLDENEMDRMIDKLLGCEEESESVDHNSSITEAMLRGFEEAIKRMETSQEEEDLFAEEETPKEERQLFPVFIKGATNKNLNCSSKPQNLNRPSIQLPIKDSGEKEQMILDAGQKQYGQVECQKCGCVYDPDDRKDVEHHLEYHNRNSVIIKHKGWKNERVIASYPDGSRVIKIVKSDPPLWWRRIEELLPNIDLDLGYAGSQDLTDYKNCMVFLYVEKKQIVGFLLAEEIEQSSRMLDGSETLCSEEIFPVLCGVARLWTVQSLQSTQVATKLVDAMRENFLSHKTLNMDEFAFSTPTSSSGREFAVAYTKTEQFLIY
ncbi:N-acetyltransferase ESCO2 isoform X2 [Neocloeon triangulifer]|nr:N-acetyltransferase ESCO2 isoform X2 [Neocloeon triangulifer]